MTDVASVAAPAAARTRRGPAAWLAAQDTRELTVWGVLFAVAVVAHLVGLGNRPFHHDESQDAYFSYLSGSTGFHYDPLLHGPLRFYLTKAMYLLFGDSNFTARLAPVLMALSMIPLCWPLRRLLGRPAAFFAAALFSFGPSFLYFGRFAREDIYFAAITLALLVAIWRYIDRPRTYHPAIIGGVLAASFATKETTFITVFVMGSFFLFSFAIEGWRKPLVAALRRPGWEGWGWFLAAFAGVFTLLFTTFLTHPGGLWDGIYTGLKYWLDQHGVARGGEPWQFYSVVLITIEWPALLLGAIGAVSLWRRNSFFAAFLIWDFVVSLIVYSWAGEKFAWLVLHPLLPVILLAGVGVQAIWRSTGAWRWVGLAATTVALFYVGLASWWVNVDRGANPREMLVSTQSAEQVKQVADQVVALSKSRGPGAPPLSVTIDSAEGATFPYAWYFRHLPVGYIDLQQANAAPPTTDVMILTDASRERLANALGDYNGRQFPFRVWWVRDYGAIRPGNLLRYITERKTWNPTGGMNEWLYVKKGL
ncbi:MAG TPA: flippase activity-associated protein Agl23 [Solirubrobacter sp.]|nr:flippase activity-associated protein Agl23 [Solirubrobacter sp.]